MHFANELLKFMVKKKIKVEIIYISSQQAGLVNQSCLINLMLDEGCSIREAIEASGIMVNYPEIDLTQNDVGIFGQLHQLSDTVQDDDRIEIYRPLIIDPKEARRRKAKQVPVAQYL